MTNFKHSTVSLVLVLACINKLIKDHQVSLLLVPSSTVSLACTLAPLLASLAISVRFPFVTWDHLV